MPYSLPPNVASTALAITNVVGNTTLVAAPGIGFAIRVVGWHFGLRQSVAAGIVDIVIQNGVGGAGLGFVGLDVAGQRMFDPMVPDPGIQLSPNTLLNASRIASVAGPLAVAATVYYYIDAV